MPSPKNMLMASMPDAPPANSLLSYTMEPQSSPDISLAAVAPSPQEVFLARNAQWTKPGSSGFNTQLSPGDEVAFRQWLAKNNVPFNASAGVTDYDMRGFFKALQSGDPKAASAVDPNDKQLHYPDYWKTPLHETFSRESQWATPNAPYWTDDDKLVSSTGQILFDDRAR